MKFKRRASAALAVIMALSAFSIGTFAEETSRADENLTIINEETASEGAISLGYSFGTEGIILKPGTYSIGVSLKNAENTEEEFAAACIKKARLTVDEEGNAGLKINLSSASVGDKTAGTSDWKIYSGASASGETVFAEETADDEGNITAIEFDLPDLNLDGVYVNMYVDALEANADAYMAIDYSSAAADGKYTADLNLNHEDTDETSAAAGYFTTKTADITVSDSSVYVKLAYTDSAVGEILQSDGSGEYSVLTTSQDESGSFVTAELGNIKAGSYLQISIASAEEAALTSEDEAETADDENKAEYYTVKLTVDTDTLTEIITAEENEDETETETETNTETETETENETETEADEEETETETSTEAAAESSSYSYSSSSGGGSSYYVGSNSSSSSSNSYNTAMAAGVVRVTIGSSSVVIDGKRSAMDAAAYIQEESSSTLVPLRFVALAILGGDIDGADESETVEWDSSSKTATVYAGDNVITFTAGSNIMVVNDEEIEMSYGVKAEITDSRMYIPFRALGEALGVDVEWEAASKTAIYRNK